MLQCARKMPKTTSLNSGRLSCSIWKNLYTQSILQKISIWSRQEIKHCLCDLWWALRKIIVSCSLCTSSVWELSTRIRSKSWPSSSKKLASIALLPKSTPAANSSACTAVEMMPSSSKMIVQIAGLTKHKLLQAFKKWSTLMKRPLTLMIPCCRRSDKIWRLSIS